MKNSTITMTMEETRTTSLITPIEFTLVELEPLNANGIVRKYEMEEEEDPIFHLLPFPFSNRFTLRKQTPQPLHLCLILYRKETPTNKHFHCHHAGRLHRSFPNSSSSFLDSLPLRLFPPSTLSSLRLEETKNSIRPGFPTSSTPLSHSLSFSRVRIK